jgi:hypothetical protein
MLAPLPEKPFSRALSPHEEKMQRGRLHNFRQGTEPGVYDEAPFLFAGSGQATPRQRAVYGGYQNELEFGVTARVAYLPNDHRHIFESRAQATRAGRETMRARPEVRSKTQGNRAHLAEWRPLPSV